MNALRLLGQILLVSGVIFCANAARGEDGYQGQPITQVTFTHLVPITYPLKTTRFTGLKPRSYPVIHPGVAQVHIIEKLVHPMEQPLLLTH